MRALMSRAPNNAPHAHRDVGNVFVTDGHRPCSPTSASATTTSRRPTSGARSPRRTTSWASLQPDGRVLRRTRAQGRCRRPLTACGWWRTKTIYEALWTRDVGLAPGSVTVRDRLSAKTVLTAPKPISTSFLLQVPPSRVTDMGEGRLRVSMIDGSTWQVQAPPGVTVTVSDASPTPPYEDTAEFLTTRAPAHTLVQLTTQLSSTLDLTTTFVKTST